MQQRICVLYLRDPIRLIGLSAKLILSICRLFNLGTGCGLLPRRGLAVGRRQELFVTYLVGFFDLLHSMELLLQVHQHLRLLKLHLNEVLEVDVLRACLSETCQPPEALLLAAWYCALRLRLRRALARVGLGRCLL